MVCIFINILEICCVVTMFIIINILNRKIRTITLQDEIKINDLAEQVLKYKNDNMGKDVHRLIEIHRADAALVEALNKIKKNYSITKKDKIIIIIQWLIVRLSLEDDYILLDNINTGKKYTYNQACDIIKNYIMNSMKKNMNIQDSLNAAYYLLIK